MDGSAARQRVRRSGAHRLLTDWPDDDDGVELAFELEIPMPSAALVDIER
jgi:hypothetical protein